MVLGSSGGPCGGIFLLLLSLVSFFLFFFFFFAGEVPSHGIGETWDTEPDRSAILSIKIELSSTRAGNKVKKPLLLVFLPRLYHLRTIVLGGGS